MGRAVLVAISIPIFTTQLEKSRDAVTVANLRAAYAEASSEYLTSSSSNSGSSEVTIKEKVVFKGQKNESDSDKTKAFSGLANELPFTLDSTVMALDGTVGEQEISFVFGTNGTVTAKK